MPHRWFYHEMKRIEKAAALGMDIWKKKMMRPVSHRGMRKRISDHCKNVLEESKDLFRAISGHPMHDDEMIKQINILIKTLEWRLSVTNRHRISPDSIFNVFWPSPSVLLIEKKRSIGKIDLIIEPKEVPLIYFKADKSCQTQAEAYIEIAKSFGKEDKHLESADYFRRAEEVLLGDFIFRDLMSTCVKSRADEHMKAGAFIWAGEEYLKYGKMIGKELLMLDMAASAFMKAADKLEKSLIPLTLDMPMSDALFRHPRRISEVAELYMRAFELTGSEEAKRESIVAYKKSRHMICGVLEKTPTEETVRKWISYIKASEKLLPLVDKKELESIREISDKTKKYYERIKNWHQIAEICLLGGSLLEAAEAFVKAAWKNLKQLPETDGRCTCHCLYAVSRRKYPRRIRPSGPCTVWRYGSYIISAIEHCERASEISGSSVDVSEIYFEICKKIDSKMDAEECMDVCVEDLYKIAIKESKKF